MAGQAIVIIRNKPWNVSVAVMPWELTQGLGGLPDMPAQSGMLFDLGALQIIQVTTVPMLFALDIVFLSETLAITEIYRNIQPGYLVTSTSPARYFLEVNAGEMADITSGDQAVIEVMAPAQTTAPDWVSLLAGFMGFVVIGVLMVSFVKDLVKGMFEEPEKRLELSPQTKPREKFVIKTDRMGNIIITHTGQPGKSVFLQFEADKEAIYDVLKKSERKELEKGWPVEVNDNEPRASVLNDLWEVAALPELKPEYLTHTTHEPDVKEYRVEKNEPYDTWSIVELWATGTVRSPFNTEEEAVKREEDIGEYYDWKLKRVPDFIAEEKKLLAPERFPERTRALHQQLKGYDVIHVHDDGDLTVRSRGKLYVVTTEGEVFQQRTGKEALHLIQRERTSHRLPAASPAKPSQTRKEGELEYLPDSPELLALTIADIGYRDKIDSVFQEAIARAKGYGNGGAA